MEEKRALSEERERGRDRMGQWRDAMQEHKRREMEVREEVGDARGRVGEAWEGACIRLVVLCMS